MVKFHLNFFKCSVLLLCLVCILLQYSFWLGSRSVFSIASINHKLALANQVNKRLVERNNHAYQKVLALKHDSKTIEQMARVDLGLIKKGETYYQYRKGSEPSISENMGMNQ